MQLNTSSCESADRRKETFFSYTNSPISDSINDFGDVYPATAPNVCFPQDFQPNVQYTKGSYIVREPEEVSNFSNSDYGGDDSGERYEIKF
jgi:hypothetical protein